MITVIKFRLERQATPELAALLIRTKEECRVRP